jgi:cyanate permease
MTAASASTHQRWVIGGMMVLFNLLYGINFSAVGPILPLIRDDYEVSRGEAGLLVTLVIVLHGACIIPGAILAGRVRLKPYVGALWLLCGSMALMSALDSFGAALGLRAVFGVAFALLFPATAPILMRTFSSREMPVVNGVVASAFTVGNMLGTFLAAPIAEVIGWQDTLSLMGAVMVGGGVAWLALARVPEAAGERARAVSLKGLGSALKNRVTLLMGLADGVSYAQYAALVTWLPTFYNQERGMSLTEAGFIVGLVPLTGLVGTLGGGLLSARVGLRRPFFIVPGCILGLAGLGTFLFDSYALTVASLLVLGVASYAYFPVMLTVPMEVKGATESSVALSWSIIYMMANGMAMTSPVAVGYMTDALGSYVPSFAVWAGMTFGLLAVGILLPETGPGRRASRVAQGTG